MALPLYPGCESFKKIRQDGYLYVDKTTCLKEFFAEVAHEDGPPGEDLVMLFTRPRRFGKTFTMSMIKEFFALNCQNPEDKTLPQSLFAGLDIMKDEAFCREYLGQYPVISISLKEVDGHSFTKAMSDFFSLVLNLYDSFSFLLENPALSATDKIKFQKILDTAKIPMFNPWFADNTDGACQMIEDCLFDLSSMLCKATGRKVMVLVDEYDVPLQKAKAKGYYREMLDVIRGMLGKVFKTNEYLFKGIVTGCLRISRESIFTGINNFSV
ncbi:MAG: AAA family ATPase, partial [Succinivibrio sp.]|nr:AAA family ATPase [Succinivibrio sp.]